MVTEKIIIMFLLVILASIFIEVSICRVLSIKIKREFLAFTEDFEGTKFLVDSMRANNHDFTNKLDVILGLIQIGQYEKAVSYIENISIKDTDTNDFLDSLTLSEYKDLESICRSAKFDLRLETDSLCVMCMKKTKVLRTIDDLLENYIISTDLDYYYKTLKYFSKKLGFSVSDFNNLYPFEIDILTREEGENNQ